jgi:hypothetical protein
MALSETDQIEIQLLYARYTHTIDDFDEMGWIDTWTDPASFDLGTAKYQGVTGLHRFFEMLSAIGGARMRHYTTNVAFREVEDRVVGRAYLMVLDTTTGGLSATGYYDDVLMSTANGWRFAERVLVQDPWPARADAPPSN